MVNQTVTRTIESDVEAKLVYEKLSDAFLLPLWAPVFAEKVEHVQGDSFRITKGSDIFNAYMILNDSSLTVDYLREMADGKRGGAYIRVIPKPLGGCVVTMNVPIGPGVTADQVAAVLEQELGALIKLVR